MSKAILGSWVGTFIHESYMYLFVYKYVLSMFRYFDPQRV